MCDYDDDLYGGMFDLDGDGKTDFFEEMVAIEFFEEEEKRMRKMREDNSSDWYERKKRRDTYSEPKKFEPERLIVPEHLDNREYKALKSENTLNLVIMILSALILCGIVGGGIYLVLSSFGFGIVPLIICGVFGVMTVLVSVDAINKQAEVFSEQKKRIEGTYSRSSEHKEKNL